VKILNKILKQTAVAPLSDTNYCNGLFVLILPL
jgi:hypothetical protein